MKYPAPRNADEVLEKGILEGIDALDEDTMHDMVTSVLKPIFHDCSTYDGGRFDHAEFEDEVLEKLKTLIETIQDQKEEAKAGSKAHAFVSNMFGDMTKSMDGLTVRAYPDPTWEKIMGRHVNKKA